MPLALPIMMEEALVVVDDLPYGVAGHVYICNKLMQ
jgi:hypothetical protein